MCKRMNLKRIIKNDFEVFSCGEVYYYPGIPDSVKVKIMKYFDPDLNPDYVVAFYDDTMFKSNRAGYVFTLTGIYFRYLMEDEVYYFNYKDITSMRVIPYTGGELDEMATLEIRLANGSGGGRNAQRASGKAMNWHRMNMKKNFAGRRMSS